MSLTNNNLDLIKAVANNDMNSARKAALASLTEDTSKKNAWVIDYYRKMLVGNAGNIMSSLPKDIQSVLVGEIPEAFDYNRHYSRPSEEKIVEEIIKMKKISEEMSLRHISYKNTTLLYGKSGTGKTELGRYIAYKLNLPFFYVSFSSTIDSYMGSTAKNIHKIFNFCNSIPCVLMLDEVDCVAAKRSVSGSKGSDGELERTTISLMQELDRLPNHVTLIAATNRLDIVDEALLRRFSIKHEIKNMSTKELIELATQFIAATDTDKYISIEKQTNLAKKYDNPGQLMPELIKEIGIALYEENKDKLIEEPNEKLDVFEVTYTWKMNIKAETAEDAVALAKEARTNFSKAEENYDVKRCDYIKENQND